MAARAFRAQVSLVAGLFVLALTVAGPARGAATLATSLSGGAAHVCATTNTGAAECWGWNYYGQIGVGTDTGPDVCGFGDEYPIGCATTPVAVHGLSDVSQTSLSYAHSCAVTGAGAAYCWGIDNGGQLGVGTTLGPETCGEYPNSCSMVPVPVTGLGSGVTAVGTGDEESCAVVVGGGVKCWGRNYDGELGDGTIADSPTPVDVKMPVGVEAAALSGGAWHMCALSTAGSVLCWGYDEWGELGDGTDTGPETCGTEAEPCATTPVPVALPGGATATAIAAGGYFTCALTGDGKVYCWGRNVEGELGRGAASEDGTTPGLVELPAGVAATAISASTFDACAVTNAGLYCWGRNDQGELGDGIDQGPELCGPGEVPCATAPVAASAVGGDPTAVATGEESTCALTAIGGVECWGFNRNGGLGDGRTAFTLTPVQVSGLTGGRRLSVSLAGSGAGEVTSDPAGLECGGGHAVCGEPFAAGPTVRLSAAAASGSTFLGFSGGGCASTGYVCEIPMTQDQAITATFGPAASAVVPAPGSTGPETSGPETSHPQSPAPPRLTVAIDTRRGLVRGRVARLRLECEGGSPGSFCLGELSLTAGAVRLGHVRYEFRTGTSRQIAVDLTGAGGALLARAPHGTLRATVTAHGILGTGAAGTILLALKPRP
jgi:alpha-tubulin suppressor-like RCC1 family protein